VRRLARVGRRHRGAPRVPYVGGSGRAVADLAVATGLSYVELGDLDPEDYLAIVEAADRRASAWGHTEELLALVLEQLGHLHGTLAALGGAKSYNLPKPVRYPRPGESDRKAPAATRAERYARIPVRKAGE